jgi:hypothetical protein
LESTSKEVYTICFIRPPTWLLTVNVCIKVRLWLASGQVSRHSQGTLLPSSGEPKVSNPWNKCVTQDLIY